MDDLSRSPFSWLLVHLAAIVQAQPHGTYLVDRVTNEGTTARVSLTGGETAVISLDALGERSLTDVARCLRSVDESIVEPGDGALATAHDFGDDWDGWSSALLDFGGYEWAFREPSDSLRYVSIERVGHQFRVTANLGSGPTFSRNYALSNGGRIEEFQARDFGFDVLAALTS
jgi:hypothetical protein